MCTPPPDMPIQDIDPIQAGLFCRLVWPTGGGVLHPSVIFV